MKLFGFSCLTLTSFLAGTYCRKKIGGGAAVFALVLVVGAVMALGCGGSSGGVGGGGVDAVSSLCQDVCACRRCTSNDRKACETAGHQASADAKAVGCSPQFDEVIAFTSAHVSCDHDDAVIEGCNAEQSALEKCSGHLSSFPTSPCIQAGDDLLAGLTACGVSFAPSMGTGGIDSGDCTEVVVHQLRCITQWFNAAPCAVVKCNTGDADACNQAPDADTEAFYSCLNTCQ